jgi:hypothetical protein
MARTYQTHMSQIASKNLSEERKKEFKNVITEQPQTSDKLVIESVADQNATLHNECVWPFHMLSAIFLNELFE